MSRVAAEAYLDGSLVLLAEFGSGYPVAVCWALTNGVKPLITEPMVIKVDQTDDEIMCDEISEGQEVVPS